MCTVVYILEDGGRFYLQRSCIRQLKMKKGTQRTHDPSKFRNRHVCTCANTLLTFQDKKKNKARFLNDAKWLQIQQFIFVHSTNVHSALPFATLLSQLWLLLCISRIDMTAIVPEQAVFILKHGRRHEEEINTATTLSVVMRYMCLVA